jgi:hypothetical protein
MGKTAVPIVAANMTIVKGPAGVYARSKHNVVVSQRLAKRNNCIATQMRGKHGSQADIQNAFRDASNACRSAGNAAPAAGRRMRRF